MKTQTSTIRTSIKRNNSSTTTSSQQKADVYQIITDAIIERLETGVIPWKCSWSSCSPANYLTKRPYSGINAFLLASFQYEHPYFLTFLQAKDLGGTIRKGAKSVPVIFYKILDKKATSHQDQFIDESTSKIPLLQYYRVFHISDVEGIEFKLDGHKENSSQDVLSESIYQNCEAIIAKMPLPPVIEHKGSQPFYISYIDTIEIPSIERFITGEEYFQTLFHELVHASGHSSRLNRDNESGFGSKSYSEEELIAEMGATFLSAHAGIATPAVIDNATGYIQGWLKALRNDRKLLTIASARAQKAVRYILGEGEESYQE